MKDLLQAIGQGVVLLDGAMGTQLIQQGLETGELPESRNVTHPEVIRQIHSSYIEAGAQVILTNTFGANRLKLQRAGAEEKLEEVNREALRLAQEVTQEKVWIGGNIGPTGDFLEPYGRYREEDFYAVFKEQAEILAQGSALFVIETMSDPREASIAIKACQDNFDLPIAASMSFYSKAGQYRTLMGTEITQVVEVLGEADIIGANCGDLSLEEMAQVIEEMRRLTTKPLFAEPNAGKARLEDGKAVYPLGPEEYARGAEKIVGAGVNLVGGCCGTTPEHIRALRKALA